MQGVTRRMIKLMNLKKKFGENVVLKDLNFTFIEKGLVMILGPSGCGKSTLLNILSGVDSSFDGSVLVDNKNLGNMTERELDQYRLVDVGYVFQNYLLMNLDKVKENIMLPLDISSNSSYKLKEEKANELMKIVGIYDKKDEICNKLSGGEKQRTAIARALVNNPNTLLCDEPTGSLDSKNTTLIMELLKNISKKKLVVVVTHDKEVAKKYGDQIVFMKDGEILNSDISHITKNENKLPLMKVRHKIGKNSLPFIYSIKRAFRHFKEKRWRTLFANFACSLSLLGIGLSSLLSSTISTEVKSSFASVLDDSQIVMKLKDEKKELLGVYSGSLVEANEVKNKYQQYIEDVGINYIINFESFFYEDNRFLFMDEQKSYVIPSLNIRHINEYSWLEGKEDLYPSSYQALAYDELILGLPYNEVKSLCEELQIKKNYETLGEYISSHNILLVLQVSNSAWKYADEQVFRLKGVAKTSRSKIYHSSHMWN